MSDPRVSVLIPTYNRPALLCAALHSLAQQTAQAFEILVLNDGGTALGTHEVPTRLLSRADLAFRAINLPHGGQSAALNAGLAIAQGTYVTVAQDDDLVLPEKLTLLSAALDDAPMDVGAVYSLPSYTTADGQMAPTPLRLRRYLLSHPLLTWADVQRDGLFIHGTATLYRRAALRAIGGWDPELPTAEEFDLHLRLLRAGWDFAAVDAVTVTYRRHPGGKSQTRSRRRSTARKAALTRIYAKLGLDPGIVTDPVP